MPVINYRINEELRKQRMIIREYGIDYLSYFYYLTPNKCCGCYPKLQLTFRGFQSYNSCMCMNCGRSTPVIDDYSWIKTKESWDKMMKEVINE